jgi:hypothetical protein
MPGHVTGELAHRHLHAQADAQVRDPPLARDLDRADLALDPAPAEPARHEDPVRAGQQPDRLVLGRDVLRVDPVDVDAPAVEEAAVAQRFGDGQVGVLELDVLADDRDPHGLGGLVGPARDVTPHAQVGLLRDEAEVLGDALVDALVVEPQRDLVDVVDVLGRDHRVDAPATANSAILRRMSIDSSLSLRHRSMSGWMPMRRSSLTECWVGFVLSSPACRCRARASGG